MKTTIRLFFLCLMAVTTISCSDDNEAKPEEKGIVGEWQLMTKSLIAYENGIEGEMEETDFSAYENKSVLIFTADKKVDFKVYDTTGDGELYLDESVGSYIEENGKIMIKFDGETEPLRASFTIDSYLIKGEQLIFHGTQGRDPLIFKATYTARRIVK